MRKLSEYKEPNIKELLWSLLIQWKGVLVVAVICGLLGTCLFYVRDSRSAAAGVSEEVQIQTSVQNQTDAIAVNSILNQEAAVEDYQEYYTSSLLMQVDPYHVPVHVLQYHIIPADDSPSGTAPAIANACANDAAVYQIANNLKESWHSDTDVSYLTELIQIESQSASDAQTADLCIRVITPEQADSSVIDQAVESALRSVSSELDGKVSPYTLRLLSSSDVVEADAELAATQRDVLADAGELERVLVLSRDQMSASQKALYSHLKDADQDDHILLKTDDSAQTDTLSVPAPHLSKKGFAYGFVFGIVIYIVFYLLSLIFRHRIQTPGKIKDVLGYRTIGELYIYPYRKGIRKVLSSRAVYQLHHRGKTDPEAQLDEITTAIFSLCNHFKIHTFHLVPLGKQPDGAAAYLDTIQNKIMQTGDIRVTTTALYSNGKITPADRELSTADAVIPVVFGNCTTDAMADAVSETCQEYGVQVPGIIYLEC